MKKIYFASTNWANGKTILDDYRYQTPNNIGVWDNIMGTSDSNEADYILIQDSTPETHLFSKFNPQNMIYISREALDSFSIKSYPKEQFNHFSYWDNTGYLPTRWIYKGHGYGGTTKTYDELMNTSTNEKTKKICAILSNKEACEGHILRKKFVRKLIEKYPIDLFGSVDFSNATLINNDKYNTLINYKYCLGFDNQDGIDNFFGTQFTDAILSDCVPIFWCGTNLLNHFPPKSFIQFDARNDNEIDRIYDIIENDNYEERINDLKIAKDLILNKYNLWPTLKKIVDENENENSTLSLR